MNERVDLDALVAELKATVDQRRSAGEYPADLDEQLDSVFARSRGLERHDYEPLKRSMSELDTVSHFGRHRISLDSEKAVGSAVHRATAAAVRRSIDGVFFQAQEFADVVRHVLALVVEALDDPRSHEHLDLRTDLDMVFQRLTDVEMEVRRFQRSAASSGFGVSDPVDIDWSDFVDRFRGTDAGLADAYADLIDRLADHEPVLDIGCGSGFLIEALASRGVEARGVDTDADLVLAATRRGLDVTQQSASSALAGAVPHSLGAVVMLHVVEHLSPAEVPQVVRSAQQALWDGGLLVIETPNASSLYAHSHSFWLDPTHVRMVPAAYLQMVLTQAGFRDVEIVPRSAVPDDEQLVELPDDVPGASVHNENIRRLNQALFAPQDVMVIGVA